MDPQIGMGYNSGMGHLVTSNGLNEHPTDRVFKIRVKLINERLNLDYDSRIKTRN